MTLPKRPERMVIVGSGAIGMEFAYFYKSMGTEVTIVEMMPTILPVEDKDVSAAMERLYKKHGFNIMTSTTTRCALTTRSSRRATCGGVLDHAAPSPSLRLEERSSTRASPAPTNMYACSYSHGVNLSQN